MLGGNNSSEVRVWLHGARNKAPYPRVGDIVAELEQQRRAHAGPENTADLYEDERKQALVDAEEKVALFLRHRADQVEMDGDRIAAVFAFDTRTSERKRFTSRQYCDGTGHGVIGYLAGAHYDMTPKGRMGMSNMWRWDEADEPASFPETPWALDFNGCNINLGFK